MKHIASSSLLLLPNKRPLLHDSSGILISLLSHPSPLLFSPLLLLRLLLLSLVGDDGGQQFYSSLSETPREELKFSGNSQTLCCFQRFSDFQKIPKAKTNAVFILYKTLQQYSNRCLISVLQEGSLTGSQCVLEGLADFPGV